MASFEFIHKGNHKAQCKRSNATIYLFYCYIRNIQNQKGLCGKTNSAALFIRSSFSVSSFLLAKASFSSAYSWMIYNKKKWSQIIWKQKKRIYNIWIWKIHASRLRLYASDLSRKLFPSFASLSSFRYLRDRLSTDRHIYVNIFLC